MRDRRCAFLTLRDPTGFVIDDELAVAPLRERGVEVAMVPWDAPDVAWERFDLVVIRSPWDYQQRPDAFVQVLDAIERRGVPLANPAAVVRWNLRKRYLRDLQDAGVPIVPTVWRDRLAPGGLLPLCEEVGTAELVVKPAIGANADGCFRLDPIAAHVRATEVEAYFADRALLAQPFVRAIVDEGEFSLFWFDGAFSHAIVKTPQHGDFRVQEEHGGIIRAAAPEPALAAAGERALAALRASFATPLYARADFVRHADGATFLLMELELIEPALYLRMDSGAPVRFADAIAARIARADGVPR